jgi:RimJ/RimL family protein N-acetyltransferase
MDNPILLRSEKLILRTLGLEDANEKYLKWMNDPIVCKYLETRFSSPTTTKELEAFISSCNLSSKNYLFGIVYTGDNEHIGNIKLGPVNKYHKSADLGFLIGEKDYWGRGLATEAISLVVEFAFRNLGLCKITAGAYSENIGSQKALIKAGFLQEGCLKSQWETDSGRQDGIVFGITKEEFIGRYGG